MNNNKQKAVIWSRVSTREQQEEGFTIDKQRKTGEAFAQEKNVRILKRFDVPESAKGDKPRVIFYQMMDYVRENNVSHIICERIDRITRNLNDSVILYEWLNEDSNHWLHFTRNHLSINKESKSDSKFRWDIEVVLAKKYSDDLSENIRSGNQEKAEQGWYPSNHKRGYKSVRPEGQKRAIWELDISPESDAPYIKQACELYAYGNYSLKQLSEKMFEEGWKQKDGKAIAKSTMADTIADPFYTGEMFRWKGKVYPNAKHEGIISLEVYQLIKEKLARKNTGKYRKHLHTYRGLMKCGGCGCSITSELQKGHIYYRCTRYKPCNQRKYIREEVIEEQIMKEFNEMYVQDQDVLNVVIKALKESHQSEQKYHNQALSNINQQYNKAQQRLDNLYLDKLDGRISTDKYDSLSEQFRQQQEVTRGQLEKHERANVNYFELGANLLNVAHNAGKIYKTNSIEKKRQLLSLVFLNLTLEGEILLIQKQKPFELIAQRVKTNSLSRERDSN